MNNEELADLLADTNKFNSCQYCEYLFKDAMCEFCYAPRNFVCDKTHAVALIAHWLEDEVKQ